MNMLGSIKAGADSLLKEKKGKVSEDEGGVEQQVDPMLDVSHPSSQLQWQPLGQIGQPGQMPSYDKGGDVPKDQVAKVHGGERVLNPEEAQAYRSAQAGEEPSGVLGRIATRAHELYNQSKALIAPIDKSGFEAKQGMINEYKQAATPLGQAAPPAQTTTQAPVDRVGAAYGSRPGEKRIDTTEMLKPLPSYDDGGDVPEDQVAEVHKDEHVLEPEKAAAYRQAEQELARPEDSAGVELKPFDNRAGKFVSIGGEKVFQNPKGLKVQYDTEKPEHHVDEAVGTKMDTQNYMKPRLSKAPQNAPGQMSIQNSPLDTGGLGETQPTLSSVKSPMQSSIVPDSKLRPLPAMGETAQAPAAAPAEETTPDPMDIIRQDKMEAMKKGDLVGLGMANIHERALAPKESQEQQKLAEVAPAEPTYTGTERIGKGTPGEAAAHQQFEDKRQDYDRRIQAAMDQGTPEGDREAASLQLAKQHFEKMNPLGSAANKPGFAGKLEHTLGRIGNIAGNIVAPGTMALIPGTDLNKAEQAENLRGQEQAATKESLAQAQAKAAGAKTVPTDKYDFKNVQDTRKNLPDGTPNPNFGKTVVAGVNKTDPSDVQFTGQVAPPATEKPETAEEHKNTYAELRNRMANGEKLTPEDQQKLGTLQAQFSVGTSNAKQFNDRIKDLGITAENAAHYQVNPTDTDAEAKEKESAARSLAEHKTAAGTKSAEQAGKVFDKYSAQLDKVATPIEAATTRSSLLVHNLDLKSKQGDALIAPELLSIAAGGAGSGLRMNEAEIARVIGGRSVWDMLASRAKQIQQEGGTFDDAQRAQLREISSYINDRNTAQTALLNKGRDALLRDQDNESAIRGTYNHVHQAVSELASKGIVPSGGKVNVGDYVYHNGEVVKISSVKDGKPQGTIVTF